MSLTDATIAFFVGVKRDADPLPLSYPSYKDFIGEPLNQGKNFKSSYRRGLKKLRLSPGEISLDVITAAQLSLDPSLPPFSAVKAKIETTIRRHAFMAEREMKADYLQSRAADAPKIASDNNFRVAYVKFHIRKVNLTLRNRESDKNELSTARDLIALMDREKRDSGRATKLHALPEAEVDTRVRQLVRKCTRRAKKQATFQAHPEWLALMPAGQTSAWERGGPLIRPPTREWCRRKLTTWALHKKKRYISPTAYERSVATIFDEYHHTVSISRAPSLNSISVGTWNISKGPTVLTNILDHDRDHPAAPNFPPHLDVICITEASSRVTANPTNRLRYKDYASTPGLSTRTLVRSPATISDEPCWPIPPVYDMKGINQWKSAEFRCTRVVKMGLKFVIVNAYVPPVYMSQDNAKILWSSLAVRCAAEINNGPVFIAGDFNMHLEPRPGGGDFSKPRRDAWEKVC